MIGQSYFVPSYTLRPQQLPIQVKARNSYYSQSQTRQSSQQAKHGQLDSNNVYIQTPVAKNGSKSHNCSRVIIQQQSPQEFDLNARQSVPYVKFPTSDAPQEQNNFTTVPQQTQEQEIETITVQQPLAFVQLSPQIPIQPIYTTQIPTQIIQQQAQIPTQLIQQQFPQYTLAATSVLQPQPTLTNQVYYQIPQQNVNQTNQQQQGVFEVQSVRNENIKEQYKPKKIFQRNQSLQNLQSYSNINTPKTHLSNVRSSIHNIGSESRQKIFNQSPQRGANVRLSLSPQNTNFNCSTAQYTNTVEEAPKRSTRGGTQFHNTSRNGTPSKGDYVVEESQFQVQVLNDQNGYVQKQQMSPNNRISLAQNTAKIEQLESRIRTLQDNIQTLNKNIQLKEIENSELQTKLLEFDNQKRIKERISEENQTLKLQIEEWQKRYNVLELLIYDKNNTFIVTGYTAYDAERLYHNLKIKQEENEALKTTITRLELNSGKEQTLKEEIDRLSDLLELKSKQCDEWKQKYINMETVTKKNKSKDLSSQINHNFYKNKGNFNFETPKMSSIFNEQNYQVNCKPITSLGRQVQYQEDSPKRSRNDSAQYNTSTLFKKKGVGGISSGQNTAILGITSYIDDLNLNKKAILNSYR